MNYLIRVLIGLSIFWMMKESTHFLYPSMNLYFTFCMTAVALFLLTAFQAIRKNTHFPCGILEIGFLLWMAYIGIYSLCFPTEQYNVTYLFCSGLYYMACVLNFRLGFFTRKGLGVTLVVVGIIECAVCWLQLFGRVKPNSTLFPVTGTLVDPNLTAMLIALAVPFVVYSLITTARKKKNRWILLLALLLSTLVLLQCRTAFLAVFFSILFIVAKERKWGTLFLHQSGFRKVVVIGSVTAILSALSVSLYFFKQASADGRMFIWKVSGVMIKEKPFTGYGYGLFEKSYNERQRKELEKEETTDTEKKNARFTLLAFNDHIEQTVCGGLTGGLIFTLIIGMAGLQSLKKKDPCAAACCGSVVIFTLVNFVVQSVVVWMAALTLFAYVSEGQKQWFSNPRLRNYFSVTILFVLCMLSLFCAYRLLRTYSAQKKLKEAVILSKSNPAWALSILEENLSDAGTSECYLRHYARILTEQGKYESAKALWKEAGKYTAHPSIEQKK